MSSVNVIDASAILAYLQGEKGEEVVEAALGAGECRVTTVNYCEVVSKLCEKGMPAAEAIRSFDDLGSALVDVDRELAGRAAELRVRTMGIGASLGDRVCLALAEREAEEGDVIVYTAEHSWKKLKWPFKVVVIRAGRAASNKSS
ncbi:MAG TPA: type II toxin-antitoxin system VapC family toxin [Phycisphaerae bacterium]|nr:type II toxin-antitoxin system VapC family toxin [Phycisphaerae bacterium]